MTLVGRLRANLCVSPNISQSWINGELALFGKKPPSRAEIFVLGYSENPHSGKFARSWSRLAKPMFCPGRRAAAYACQLNRG